MFHLLGDNKCNKAQKNKIDCDKTGGSLTRFLFMNDVEKVVFADMHRGSEFYVLTAGRVLLSFSLQKMICGENAPAVSLEI